MPGRNLKVVFYMRMPLLLSRTVSRGYLNFISKFLLFEFNQILLPPSAAPLLMRQRLMHGPHRETRGRSHRAKVRRPQVPRDYGSKSRGTGIHHGWTGKNYCACIRGKRRLYRSRRAVQDCLTTGRYQGRSQEGGRETLS